MLTRYDSAGLGTSDLGWLRSRFHFSLADYHDPARIHFGVLRVVNDDLVAGLPRPDRGRVNGGRGRARRTRSPGDRR